MTPTGASNPQSHVNAQGQDATSTDAHAESTSPRAASALITASGSATSMSFGITPQAVTLAAVTDVGGL